MKRVFLLIFLFCFTSGLWSQGNNTQNNKRPFSVFYGKKFLQDNTFNGQLNSLQRPAFNGPVSIAGFEIGIKRFFYGPGNSHIFYLLAGLTLVLPSNIRVNDSTTAKLSGWQGDALLFGKSFRTKNKKAGIRASLGINMGRVTLKKDDLLRMKNDLISPKLSLRPWLLLKPVRLGFICEYEYDLSNKDWKPMKKKAANQAGPGKFSQTGLSVYFSVGINIL